MNTLKHFNDAMDYIESHLDKKIDYEHISRITRCASGLFPRIFSVISNMSLGEYIRLRRLSEGGKELKETDQSVMMVAIKYGYESADSFSAAFKRFHGISPSEAKKGGQIQVFSPIHFTLKIKGGGQMNVRMEKKPAFKVAGMSQRGDTNMDFPGLWDRLFAHFDGSVLESFGSGQSYGACSDMGENGKFTYMAGFEVQKEEKAREMGLDILSVPEAEYAIFELTGPIPKCIHEGWEYMMGIFFPQNGYRHAGSPDFEVYFEGDMYREDYKMELWVPVEKIK